MYKKIFILLFLFLPILLLVGCFNQSDLNKVVDAKDFVLEKIALQEKLDYIEQQLSNLTIPYWAKQLNISEPENMTLDQSRSYQTTEEVEGFNSIRYVYTGDYDVAMQEAKKIAQKAGIAVSEEFQMAQDIVKQAGENTVSEIKGFFGNLKGILYSNYSITKNPESDNMISVSVEEDGTLEIVVTDRKNMQKANSDILK